LILARLQLKWELLEKNDQISFFLPRLQSHSHFDCGFNYPITRGLVTNFDDLEAMITYCYNQLPQKVDIPSTGALVTDAQFNPLANREIMCELMMEGFQVPLLWIENPAFMSIWALLRNSGTCVDIGDGLIQLYSISEGSVLREAAARIDLAGTDITHHLSQILNVSEAISKDIKEQYSYVAPDYLEEINLSQMSSCRTRTHILPDGKSITVNEERFQCSEILFNPEYYGLEKPSLPQMILNSVKKCNLDSRMYTSYVVFSGGGSMIAGLEERLQRELNKNTALLRRIDARARAPDRSYATWTGSSIMTSLKNWSKTVAITQQEYQEYGTHIVSKKCVNLI